ncbi:MAG TPA: response regulator [Patescibacteria group bacterium]|jgi:DNA-binding NtrC family response regulator|nr:response regulator [Patescibacteria group bacterium]
MTSRDILVIDDEAFVRKIICDNMRMSGFGVSVAAGCDEGLSMIDPASPPGVIITDIIMPQKSGFEVIAEVSKRYPSVKIVAISGGGKMKEGDEDLLEKAAEAGAHAVLAKPLDIDELERTVEILLSDT